MTPTKSPSRALLVLMLGALLSTACVDPVSEAERPCPCAEGWTCCPDVQLCVADATQCQRLSPAAPTEPSAPRQLAATAAVRAVELAWFEPEKDGGSAISGYLVQVEPTEESTVVTVDGRTARVTGLRPGATYRFTVAARNTVGLGPTVATEDVRLADVPQAPASLAVERGDGQVRVTWERPASDGGLGLLGYVVTAHPSGVSVETGPEERSAVLTGLANGQTTTVTVRALNPVGPSAESQPSTSVVPARAPAEPASVAAVPGVRSMSVSWEPPTDTGGLPVTGFTVTAMPGGATQQVDSTTLSTSFTGLQNDTAYTFTVAALNEVGPGRAQGSGPTLTPSLPSAPSGVTATPGVRSLTVRWEPPSSDGRMALTGFTVTASPSNISVNVGPAAREATLEAVPSTKEQTVTVTARNAVGDSMGATLQRLRSRPAPVELTRMEVVAEERGCHTVSYELRHPDWERADVRVEVDADGDGTFTAATQAADRLASGLVGVSTYDRGQSHTFRWNRSRDIPGAAPAAQVRLTATVPGSPSVTRTVSVPLEATRRRCEVDLTSSPMQVAPVLPSHSARDMALGDFDQDGKQDVVVLHDGEKGLSILRGMGNGRFDRPITNIHAIQGDSVTAADMNRDGLLDLVTVTNTPNIAHGTMVQVAFGLEGSGFFAAPVTTTLVERDVYSPLKPRPAVVRDLDGDGTPEVAVATPYSFFVLRHTGGGTLTKVFTAPSSISRGPVVTGDFDEDGLQDLMVVGESLNAFYGRGLLAFTHEYLGHLGGMVPSAVSGDFNGDGHLDIIALVLGGSFQDTAVQFLQGAGDGRFLAPVTLHQHEYWSTYGYYAHLAAVDADTDGVLDVTYLNGLSEKVFLFHGRGDGTFEQQELPSGRYPLRVATADLDSSGKPDLAVLSRWDDVRVLRDMERATPTAFGSSVVTADFDGDGHDDAASLTGGQLQVHLTRAEGGLVHRGPFPLPDWTWRLVPARVDAGPTVDMLAVTYNDSARSYTLLLLRGNGDGTFTAPETVPTGGNPDILSVGDVDADGKLDVVCANRTDEAGFSTHEVRVLRGQGDGTFTQGPVLATHSNLAGLALKDLNRDGRTDLAMIRGVYPTFELSLFEARADGTLVKVREFTPVESNTSCSPSANLLIEDLDRDGDMDIAVGCQSGQGGLRMLWAHTDFNYFTRSFQPLNVEVHGLAAGDLDGDGAPELLITGSDHVALCVLRYEGALTYEQAACYGTLQSGAMATRVHLLDVEHDGVPEVLTSGVEARTTLLRLK